MLNRLTFDTAIQIMQKGNVHSSVDFMKGPKLLISSQNIISVFMLEVVFEGLVLYNKKRPADETTIFLRVKKG